MTKLMGILNVTPDSFSDQGKFFSERLAVERGIQIEKEGADILDIGGESTRPFAQPVSEEEEKRRTIPIIKELKKCLSIPISIDTMKASVAELALHAGASIINDVSGGRDAAMVALAANLDCPICIMHMHETPLTMQISSGHYKEGITPFLITWFSRKIEELQKLGIKEKNIILDPGIGFGKTVAENIEIIQNLPKIKSLGFQVMIGISRKSFLKKIINQETPHLLAATLAMNTMAILAKTDIIRVHDVADHHQLIKCLNSYHHLVNY